MKITILYLIIIIAVVSTCFVTNAMAAPKITGIQGGYGVTATVADANGRDWRISYKRTIYDLWYDNRGNYFT